jgi:NADH:ubiquinone oxidoreductase subunit C
MMPDSPVEAVLRKRFARIQILESCSERGEERLLVRRRNLVEALQFLHQDADTQLDMLVDVTAIQHMRAKTSCVFEHELETPYFEVCYALRSTRLQYRLRVSVMIPQEMASLPSIVGIYPNANWLEREVWDLFGIFIEGHPDLRRILMSESFEGHPLRKDYE